jgi:anti-sigma regulatory factor (Ser/Thr protein kinase)
VGPTDRTTHQLDVDPTASASRDARRWLHEILDTEGVVDRDGTVALLTSELVTNAVLHARTSAIVLVEQRDGCVRVSVKDQSAALPVMRDAPHESATGRGLAIVDALSDRWGFDVVAGGKVVWFELTTLDGDSS